MIVWHIILKYSACLMVYLQSCSSRDDKISRLLDLLPMRGSQAFDKFSDLLQLSGHYFLSDFLRDEGKKSNTIENLLYILIIHCRNKKYSKYIYRGRTAKLVIQPESCFRHCRIVSPAGYA